MRHCPKCGSSYTDDTLVFCLQDGATLQSSAERMNPLSMVATLHDDSQPDEATAQNIRQSSAPTVEIPQSAMPTGLYEEARPTARPTNRDAASALAPAPPSNTGRVVGTTILATVLILGLGSIGAWLFFRGEGQEGSQPNSNSAPSANAANSQNARGAGNQGGDGDRADKGGRWFVILASFQNRDGAVERTEALRRQGIDARVESSNDYPNFKSDLWLVLMGPYTRNRAEEVLGEVRPKVRDAYTKSGW